MALSGYRWPRQAPNIMGDRSERDKPFDPFHRSGIWVDFCRQSGARCAAVRDTASNARRRWRASIQKHPGPPTEELRLVSVEVCLPITRLAAQWPFNRKTSQQTEEIAMRNVNQDLRRLRQPYLLSFSASLRCYLGNLGLQ